MMTTICYSLPNWLSMPSTFSLPRMDLQIEYAVNLSKLNVQHKTGGPFGAAVFRKSGELIGVGVNRVMPEKSSLLHAEIMALMVAQANLQTWDLSDQDLRLVTSCQPCCMCFGAILWSGVSEMVYAATAKDARDIGFDEGPLVADWRQQMIDRGINVQGPIIQEAGIAVLQDYARQNSVIYNPGASAK